MLRRAIPTSLVMIFALAWGTPVVMARKATNGKPNAAHIVIVSVKKEIGRKWPLFETAEKSLNVSKAKARVDCEKITKSKYVCQWAVNNNIGERAKGSARVTYFGRNAEAALYNIKYEREW